MRLVYASFKENNNTKWVASGWAANTLSEINEEFISEKLFFDMKAVNDADVKKKVCCFLGARTDFEETVRAIKYCRMSGIYSVFVFDHWGHYEKHFQDENNLCLPDQICVMDMAAYQGLETAFSKFGPGKESLSNRVSIIGQPYIESSIRKIHSVPEIELDAYRKSIGAIGLKLDLFLLEPLKDDFGTDSSFGNFLGFTEYDSLEYYFNNMSGVNTKTIIKIHPRQNLEEWDEYLKSKYADKNYELVRDKNVDFLIAAANEVYGMYTIALIIACKAGKKINSVQVGRNEFASSCSSYYLEKNVVV